MNDQELEAFEANPNNIYIWFHFVGRVRPYDCLGCGLTVVDNGEMKTHLFIDTVRRIKRRQVFCSYECLNQKLVACKECAELYRGYDPDDYYHNRIYHPIDGICGQKVRFMKVKNARKVE